VRGGGRGALSGVILGFATTLLLQQFAVVDLGTTMPGVLYFVLGGVIGGVVFGLVGRRLDRRTRPGVQPWEAEKPPPDEPAADPPTS
jgi:hypothetical protein